MKIEIAFDGVENMLAAERYCNGYCYRGLYHNGRWIGQLEPVISIGWPGYKCSPYPALGLCVVSYIDLKDLDNAINVLKRIGITGIVNISLGSYKDNPDDYRCNRGLQDFNVFMQI